MDNTIFLDREKCIGCIACMRRCPTEAIRVNDGKAQIDYDKCISCGECVRKCHVGASKTIYDSFEDIKKYKYKIALPSPTIFGQFNNLEDINYVLDGLYRLGFDKVFEVGVACELVSDCTKQLIKSGTLKRPIINSSCPAIVELILLKFPNLKDNLLNVLPPPIIAGKYAKAQAIKLGIPEEDIGVFYISPCPSMVAELKKNATDCISGVLSQSEIYFRLLPEMKKIEVPKSLTKMAVSGLKWACSCGESDSLGLGNYVHCSGLGDCKALLREIEDGKLEGMDFVELNICSAGCVGGILNIANPYVARAKTEQLTDNMRHRSAKLKDYDLDIDFFKLPTDREISKTLQFDEDRTVAIKMMMRVEEILKQLPGKNCGICGAPTCRCYAEDVVLHNLEPVCPRITRKK